MAAWSPERATGLVLAGGQGSRMGHRDKGLEPLRGYPMVLHVVLRLAPQVGSLLINANRNLEVYQSLGHPVIPDVLAGFAGPLAGMHAGLLRCETEFLLTAPCDAPFLPEGLASRLYQGLAAENAELAVARTGAQSHPVFCLMRQRLLAHLESFLDGGGRKIDAWYASLPVALVAFDDEPAAFANINTLEELRGFEPPPA